MLLGEGVHSQFYNSVAVFGGIHTETTKLKCLEQLLIIRETFARMGFCENGKNVGLWLLLHPYVSNNCVAVTLVLLTPCCSELGPELLQPEVNNQVGISSWIFLQFSTKYIKSFKLY